MVVVDLEGNKVEGKYNPSSDTATHVVLFTMRFEDWRYCAYPFILGYKLGTGRKIHSMLWNNTCGLYLRRGSMRA